MLKRLLTAMVLLPVVVYAVLYAEIVGTTLLSALAASVGVAEFLRLGAPSFSDIEERTLSFWAGFIVLSFLHPLPLLPVAALALGTLVFMMYEGIKNPPSQETIARITKVAASWLLVAYFMGHAVILRRHGQNALIFLMLLVIIGDSAAFFVGTAFGRHRLAPSLSPKKSIEGSLGGMFFVALAAFYAAPVLKLPHTGAEAVAIAVAINIAAQCGDLVESLLKRAAGVKDSGTIFPGHGGMLDRLDSFLPTLPLYAAILSVYGGK